MTGYPAAIEDFEAYIKWASDEDTKAQRQGWVTELEAGKNTFTDEVLKKLQQNGQDDGEQIPNYQSPY